MRKSESILEPSNFADDWYGWATNQISHIGVGCAAVFALSMTAFGLAGEFPDRIHMLLAIATIYILFEVWVQGWRGFDTVEDTIFVVAYGAAAPLAASAEMVPGSSIIIMAMDPLLPFFYVATAHLAFGILWRKAAFSK